jgi:hypothetical protein
VTRSSARPGGVATPDPVLPDSDPSQPESDAGLPGSDAGSPGSDAGQAVVGDLSTPDGDVVRPDGGADVPADGTAAGSAAVSEAAVSEAAVSRFAWLRGRWVGPVVFVALGILLFVAYLAEARTVAASSESGGQALQAWDMLHGNPLLRGWQLSDVSFYTTELPEYMLVELVRGLNSDTEHVAAALTYTLMVLLAGLVAKGRATGREGLVRLLIAAGIMLALPLSGVTLLLWSPDHTGTQVPLLVIWLVLDRARPRWWTPVAVGVLLAWAQIADTLVLYEGALPLIAVCAVRMYRRRGPLSGQWYELSLAVSALASVAAARLVLLVIHHAGGFAVKTPIAKFQTSSGMTAQFWPDLARVLDVFGANFFGATVGAHAFAALVHLVGVALVAWAVATGIRRIFGMGDLVEAVLTIAFVIQLIAYLFGTKQDPNEIVGLLPIGAVLAGRLLGGRLLRAGLVPALAVVLACLVGLLAQVALTPPAPVTGRDLIAPFLRAHDLKYGLAGFWNASTITVQTGDHIQVRPARMYRNRLVTTLAESDASWYDARQHDANFVIASRYQNCGGLCLGAAGLRKTFGPPAATYAVGTRYLVLVWDKNLLPQLRTLYWCYGWPWKTPGQAVTAPCR